MISIMVMTQFCNVGTLSHREAGVAECCLAQDERTGNTPSRSVKRDLASAALPSMSTQETRCDMIFMVEWSSG